MGFTKVSGCLFFADVLRGNVVGEPNLVVAQIKRMPCGVHGGGVDNQHNGLAVALPDFLRGGDVGGKVHMVAAACDKPLGADAV